MKNSILYLSDQIKFTIDGFKGVPGMHAPTVQFKLTKIIGWRPRLWIGASPGSATVYNICRYW